MHISSMEEEEEEETAMKRHHFVLVHGIGGGGWCWYKIRCLMENSGHRVSCIDLTSGGIDLTDADSVHSFDVYNKPLMDFMSLLPDQEQVILVGHSAGGLSVTEATHKFAKKISVAVYLAATMLKLGFQTDDDIKDGVPDLSEFGDVYDLGFGLGTDHPPTSALVKKHYQRTIIYHMSSQEDSTLARMLLRPGPILAITSARFTEGQEDSKLVPRVYIRTAHDRVIKPHQQDNMINKWPPSQVMDAPLTGTDLRACVMSGNGITLKNFKPALPRDKEDYKVGGGLMDPVVKTRGQSMIVNQGIFRVHELFNLFVSTFLEVLESCGRF